MKGVQNAILREKARSKMSESLKETSLSVKLKIFYFVCPVGNFIKNDRKLFT